MRFLHYPYNYFSTSSQKCQFKKIKKIKNSPALVAVRFMVPPIAVFESAPKIKKTPAVLSARAFLEELPVSISQDC